MLELMLQNPGEQHYALELVERSRRRLGRGTVYVTLARMEEKGYLDSRQETPVPGWPGHPRRLYTVTGLGRRVYEAWQLAQEHMAGAMA